VNYVQRITLFSSLVIFLFSGTLAAEDMTHIVTGGETIYSLSRFYGVSADDLMRVNNITDPSRLFIGRRLVIPAADEVSALPASVIGSGVTLFDYRAVRGDTLYGIARAYEISLQALLEMNRFSSDYVLKAGDVIKVPGGTAVQASLPSGWIYTLRWPVAPKDISYMTGQMGVIVEGEQLESVRSITAGNVISAGPWRKFGRVVIVEASGGYYYVYGGCEAITVNVGDRVTSGMELGRLGINSVSVKPQLFFMVFRNDTPLDPASAPRS